MRLLIAIVFPFVSFFTIGRPFSALICLVLQVTLIGCLPAALWATYSLGQWRAFYYTYDHCNRDMKRQDCVVYSYRFY